MPAGDVESTNATLMALDSAGSIAAAVPMRVWERRVRMGLIALQLAAALLTVYAFELETRSFFSVLLLASVGFVASDLLPMRHRLGFFAGLSILALIVAIGMDAASVVLAAGGLLIVVCHLPLPIGWRVGLIVLTAGAAAALRRHFGDTAVVPILASMFMFRLMLYLYELRHERGPFTPARALAYFFMLPNGCFLLFPVVDYQEFHRRHFDADDIATYEEGPRWILRGLLQLLFRRLIAAVFVVDDLSVDDLGDLVRYLVAAFAAYLDVSGSFHVIVGILHLFGFRLSETHHRYLLASNVTDLWRRMNIYWKDFMMKLVYYPSYFALRRRQPKWALAASTVAVFVASWGLHSFQQFWLTGRPRLSWQDASFWAVFAGLVVGATLRSPAGPTVSAERGRWDVRRAASTVSTMSAVLVLWSYWTAQSVATWFYMWTNVRFASTGDVVLIIILVGGLGAIAGFEQEGPFRIVGAERGPLTVAARRAALRLLGVLLLAALTFPVIFQNLPVPIKAASRALRKPAINPQDPRDRILGYYEGLAVKPKSSWEPWQRVDDQSDIGSWDRIEVSRPDMLLHGPRPGFNTVFEGKRVSVNRWGMRDRDYDLYKLPNTTRIALIGASYVMGWGVSDDETFDARLEASLDSIARRSGHRVEVLNISATAWALDQSAYAITAMAARFSPDLVLLATNPGAAEAWHRAWMIAELQANRRTIADPTLAALVTSSGVASGMSAFEIAVRLRLVEDAWSRRLADWIIEMAAGIGARVAVVEVGIPDYPLPMPKPIARAVKTAGIPLLDCSNPYEGDEVQLKVSPTDSHPNAEGHRMIARCLELKLAAHPSLLPAWRADRR